MPTKLGEVAGCSITRPCECGLGLRPRRLFGFPLEPVDGAPCFFTGSIAPRGCGLPSTDSLSGFVSAGNGKIQGGAFVSVLGAVPAGVNAEFGEVAGHPVYAIAKVPNAGRGVA